MGKFAFLFDVEGVLRKGNLRAIGPAFSALAGVSARRFPRALGGEAEEVSEIFVLAREGVLSVAEFRDRVREELLEGGAGLTDEEFDRAYCAGFPLTLDPAPFQVVRHLRERGHRCFILSNNNFIHTALLRRQAQALLGPKGLEELFEATLFSYEIGARKPDRTAFSLALSKIAQPPGEVVFIDDKARNTEVAESMGMKTILLQSGVDLGEAVESFLTWITPQLESGNP